MARTSWLVNSRGFAMKVMNAADSIQKENWKSDASIACPNCSYKIENSHVTQEWPGLPAGVKFDPTDQELLGHLSAKFGTGNAQPHPFIDEFISTLEEENGICYTHPGNLPGVKQDGSSVHVFHRTAKAYTTGPRKCRKIQSRENVRWHKTGVTRPVYENGKQKGCKKIMVLYMTSVKGSKPEKTKWVMHQYHLGTDEDEKEGEFVVSKIFYQQEKPCPKNDPDIPQEDVGPSIGKGGPVTPKTSTPPLRSWNQHAGLEAVKEEHVYCPLSPQAADLDATIHQLSEGKEAVSDRYSDLPNAIVGSIWSAGESQLWEDSQEPLNHILGTDEDVKEGEFVVSKIIYQQEKPCPKNDPEIPQEDVGPSIGKGGPVTPKTSTPPLRSWNQHAGLEAVKEEHVYCPLSPQAADLDATIHQLSKGKEAESDRYSDLPNAIVGSIWSVGESQLWEDSQEPINHILACNEILENRSSEANIEGGNCMPPGLTECGRIKSNKLEKELHQPASSELDNIDLDTPPDVLITDSQFSSQESTWHVSWLNKNTDWASSLSGTSLGDSQ